MSRTLQVKLDLTVADDANDFTVCDFLFDLLVDNAEVDANESIQSVDGTFPDRTVG